MARPDCQTAPHTPRPRRMSFGWCEPDFYETLPAEERLFRQEGGLLRRERAVAQESSNPSGAFLNDRPFFMLSVRDGFSSLRR